MCNSGFTQVVGKSKEHLANKIGYMNSELDPSIQSVRVDDDGKGLYSLKF